VRPARAPGRVRAALGCLWLALAAAQGGGCAAGAEEGRARALDQLVRGEALTRAGSFAEARTVLSEALELSRRLADTGLERARSPGWRMFFTRSARARRDSPTSARRWSWPAPAAIGLWRLAS